MKKLFEEKIQNILKEEKEKRENLENIINEYIDFVEENIPSEFMSKFGIGPAGSHSQFGTTYGFIASGTYKVPRSGYNIAGDFNAVVKGSRLDEMIDFATNIPRHFDDGMEAIKDAIGEIEEIEKHIKYFN